jgi:FkbM family methyltransferase
MAAQVRSSLLNLYAKAFSSGPLSTINAFLLDASLRASGFNNYTNARLSGETFFVETVLPKITPKICVDVGANVGAYTSALMSLETVDAVYAFEPLPETFEKLIQLKQRFGDRLVAINKAVGQKNERTEIFYNPAAVSQASLYAKDAEVSYVANSCSLEVEVVTLDEFFTGISTDGDIDFIKIDAEGFEFEVLQGSQRLIMKHSPMMIQIEHNVHHLRRNQTILSFAALMQGYDLFQMLPSRLVRRDPEDPLSNIFVFSNYVFVRKDLSEIASVRS